MKPTALLLSLLCLIGCRSQEREIADVDLSLVIERMDDDLYALRDDDDCRNLPRLREKYGAFFERYNTGVIRVGASDAPLYCDAVRQFLNHPVVDSAYRRVRQTYAAPQPLFDELADAFKHFKYFFPDAPVPHIYTYVSGFNEALMLTDSAVGVSLDQFLGADCPLYERLGKARYLRYNMRPERIAPLCLQTWINAEYPEPFGQEATLLARIVYEGKILCALRRCMPDKPLEDLLGFRPEKLQWCIDNERTLWQHLIQERLLFVTAPFTIQKYAADAPFTPGFPNESPGKAANWIGYRIVCRYLRQKPCDLPELLRLDNAQQLLKDAKYNP